jgi:hypothetical protein
MLYILKRRSRNMKTTKHKLIFITVVIVFCLTISSVIAKFNEKNPDLEISIETVRPSYVLGEIVEFQVNVKNNSSRQIIHRGLNLASGYLSLYVATEDGIYKKHNYYRRKDISGFLKPETSYSFKESVLWNGVPKYADMRLFPKDLVSTNYLFPKAGVYYLKLKLVIPQEGGTSIVESDPITLVINKPIGEDAEIWNKLKDRSELGLFIQSGGGAIKKQRKANDLLAEVENLISKHPTSIYVNKLKDSRLRFLETKEKIRQSEIEKQERERKLKEKLRKGEPLVPETIDNFEGIRNFV